MPRLRRLVVSDRYFFITCNLLRSRNRLEASDFETLAEVMQARRQEHGFLLTAWVFLPDHGLAVLSVLYPKTLSLVVESVKVSSTRQINTRRRESGRLWQGRFFDRALRTVKDGPPLSPLLIEEGIQGWSLHWNPLRRGLVTSPGEWPWSSYADYAAPDGEVWRRVNLRIDRVRLPAEATARI